MEKIVVLLAVILVKLLSHFYVLINKIELQNYNKEDCYVIEVYRIDTLKNHVVMRSFLNGDRSYSVKVIVEKDQRLLDTIVFGKKYCLSLIDYASPLIDSNGTKRYFPLVPYCIELDEQDICIDLIVFKKLLFYINE